MSPNLIVSCVIVLVVGFLGMLDGAAADTRRAGYPTGFSKNESNTVKTVVTRTVGWSRYYGYRIYRCRRFSSECYYFRPAHYVRHYINSKTLNPGKVTKAQNTSDKIDRGQIIAAYWVSGGFVRITSPGHSFRWIRADAPSLNRQEIKSTLDIVQNPRSRKRQDVRT